MARLYIFAIGGTGSRVLKSLTMLLAAGVKATQNNFEIVPIIIDPHKGNNDLKRTVRLMDNYQKISTESNAENGFFATKISTLDKIIASDSKMTDSFVFDIQDVSNTKFRDYIDFNQLDESNKALTDLLFSGYSTNKRQEKVNLLDVEMDIGFVGNPNIGSIVLDQFKDSVEFREFANNFNDGDRIFIISSIFGGTGAAGFPTILKNIRNARNTPGLNAQGFLENAPIGAITVMPYFNLETDDKSPIQRADFIAKTRSALYYYKESVNKKINALYYVGDDFSGKAYKNDPGDGGQQNEAHFIELAASMAVINFMDLSDSELQCNNGKSINPVFKEFSIRNNSESVNFSDLEDFTERQISKPLAQLTLFKRFLDEQMSKSAGLQAWSTDLPTIDKIFLDSPFYRNSLREFFSAFGEWIKELSANRRGFSPLNMSGDLEALIAGKKLKSGLFSKKVDFSYIDAELSKLSKGKSYASPSEKLMQIFHTATEKILNEKYGMNN